MLNKEEIEKAKERLTVQAITSKVCCEDYPNCICMKKDLIIVLQYIDQLENQIEAKKMEHKYDANMIDEVKGESVKLYKEIRKLNKIIEEMSNYIGNLDVDEDICKKVKRPLCNNETSVPVSYCVECIKQYFEKKVEGK